MRKGKVVHQGSPEELIQPDILRDIYEMEIAVEMIGGNRIGIYYL
jgi:iron complex transport system ATP-binding protein